MILLFLIIFTWIIITFTVCAYFETYGHEVTSDCIFSKILTFDSIIQFAWVSHNTCDVISCQCTWKWISLLNLCQLGCYFHKYGSRAFFIPPWPGNRDSKWCDVWVDHLLHHSHVVHAIVLYFRFYCFYFPVVHLVSDYT